MSNLADLDNLMADLDSARRPAGGLGQTRVYAPGSQVSHTFSRSENTVTMTGDSANSRTRDSPSRERSDDRSSSPQISRPKSPASNRKVQPIAQSPRQAGGATAELDDLMASLNDFKVTNDGTVKRSSETTTTTTTYNTSSSSQKDQQQHRAPSASPAPYSETQKKNGAVSANSTHNHQQNDSSYGRDVNSYADNRAGMDSRNSDTSDNQCAGCQKNVNGQDCRKPFDSGSFFDLDGRPYCEQHYHANRGSVCGTCQQPISGRCVTAMGKKFHPDHFVCSYCVRPLNKGTFKEHANKPWCHNCFDRLYGSKKEDGFETQEIGSFEM